MKEETQKMFQSFILKIFLEPQRMLVSPVLWYNSLSRPFKIDWTFELCQADVFVRPDPWIFKIEMSNTKSEVLDMAGMCYALTYDYLYK